MNRRSLSDQSLCSPSSIDKSVNTKLSYSTYNRWTFIFFLFGLVNILNALWMVIVPEHWYYTLPTVPESGTLNIHFVRDIGCIFLLLGCGIIVGAFVLPENSCINWMIILISTSFTNCSSTNSHTSALF